MPDRSSKPPKRPRDLNQLAAAIVAEATRDPEDDDMPAGMAASATADDEEPPAKNPAAVALGRLGGLKGGPARMAQLTAKQRKAQARKAAAARWKKST